MLGLIVFLCIICPWLIPCFFCIWILDKLCWKFINWSIKFSEWWTPLSFKARYFLSWGIVGIIFIPWCLLLGGEASLGAIALIIFLFIIYSILVGIVALLKKICRKVFKGA